MNKEEVEKAVKVLRDGGVILYPTDTIWGLGCDARNSEAVKRIFEIKKRKESKSLITLLGDELELQSYVREVPEIAWDLIEFSEKPLSVIYEKIHGLSSNVLAEDGSAAIRIVKNGSPCSNLLKAFRGPLVSTSANISGEHFTGNFDHIPDTILSRVDFVFSDRTVYDNTPSKVVKLGLNGDYKLIRA